MNNWKKLLKQVDLTLDFPNRAWSELTKIWQGYDHLNEEHIVQLEYRVITKPILKPEPGSKVTTRPSMSDLNLLKDLLQEINKQSSQFSE